MVNRKGEFDRATNNPYLMVRDHRCQPRIVICCTTFWEVSEIQILLLFLLSASAAVVRQKSEASWVSLGLADVAACHWSMRFWDAEGRWKSNYIFMRMLGQDTFNVGLDASHIQQIRMSVEIDS